MITASLAAILFYLAPLLLGNLVFQLIHDRLGTKRFSWPMIIIAGVTTIFILYALMSSFVNDSIISIGTFRTLMSVAIVVLLVASIIKAKGFILELWGFFKSIPLVLYVTMFSVFIVGIVVWRIDSPYPSPLNWDIYEHLTLAHKLNDGVFSLWLKDFSDTFLVNSYLPLYHTLLALPLLLFRSVDILGYYWMLELIHFFSIIAASGYIIWVVTKDKWATVIGIIFGGFVFGSFVAYTSFFHLPQTITALFAIIFIAFLLQKIQEKTLPSPLVLFGMVVFLALNHYFVGVVSAGILALIYLYGEFDFIRQKNPHGQIAKILLSLRTLNIIVGVLTLLLIAIVIFNQYLVVNPFNTTESIHFNLDITEKFRYLLTWYGGTLLLFPVGLVSILRSDNRIFKLVLIVTLILLVVILIPFPYNLKIFTIGRFFVCFVIAVGITYLLQHARLPVTKRVFVIFWALVLVVTLYLNQSSVFKTWIRYGEIYTHVSESENEAGQFLHQNYSNEKALLVSEPATQYILEALSGVNTQGGMYASINTRKVVDGIYPASNPQLIKDKIMLVEDKLISDKPDVYLLAISGRFFEWQKWDFDDKAEHHINVWKTYDIPDSASKYITMLDNSEQFTKVFANDAVVIFEVARSIDE